MLVMRRFFSAGYGYTRYTLSPSISLGIWPLIRRCDSRYSVLIYDLLPSIAINENDKIVEIFNYAPYLKSVYREDDYRSLPLLGLGKKLVLNIIALCSFHQFSLFL